MALSTVTSLETLPTLVLGRICDYLGDDPENRHSLWAFSLTSRKCCAAAAAQRFCQIQVKIRVPDELESLLRQWNALLSPDDRHCHVQRLKVLKVTTKGEQQQHERSQTQDREADDDENNYDWHMRYSLDVHDFCRPSKSSMKCWGGNNRTDNSKAWLPLSHFIRQLPALKDLVWACGSNLPLSVLSAVHDRGCRLHMHQFHLFSLVQSRNNPQPINQDDYALATSPSLFSITTRLVGLRADGMIDYNEEAVMRLVAGMAPNLAHVWLNRGSSSSSLALEEAVRLGKPAWGGLFLNKVETDKLPTLGNLQSLVFAGYVSPKIENWSCYTNFTNLRCFSLLWDPKSGIALAKMAIRSEFKSVNTLAITEIQDETKQTQEALKQILENLNPLHRLCLEGYISNEAFDIVLRCHGKALRSLSVYPYRDDELRNPLVVFSEAVVQRLAEQCPKLEEVQLPISRTRGDHQETGIYRMLSRLPRLRRAFLRLGFWVGPDEDDWDEETDGPHPFSQCRLSGEEIPFAYLREAFSNSAMDATLALSIFDLISSGGSLTYLRLEMDRKMGPYAPEPPHCHFTNILRWFGRSWACKQDARGRVTVQELNTKETAWAGDEWRYLSEEKQYRGEEIYVEVFNDIWPRRTPEWWKDWKSLPLSGGVA